MKSKYDAQAGCGYVSISGRPVVSSIVVNEKTVCDLDANGLVSGIEVIGVSESEFNAVIRNISASAPARV
jgi:uncharacterized protein YuzE